jgi:hypothetical protein
MKSIATFVLVAMFAAAIAGPVFAANRAMEPEKDTGMAMKDEKKMDGKMGEMKTEGMKTGDKMGGMQKDDKMGGMDTKTEQKDGMKMEGNK